MTYIFNKEHLAVLDKLLNLLTQIDLSVVSGLFFVPILGKQLNDIRCLVLIVAARACCSLSTNTFEQLLDGVESPAFLEIITSKEVLISGFVHISGDKFLDDKQGFGIVVARDIIAEEIALVIYQTDVFGWLGTFCTADFFDDFLLAILDSFQPTIEYLEQSEEHNDCL